MVTYGEPDTFSVQFGTGGAYRPFILEYTSVGVPWTTIANLTTNAAGFASFTYTPTRTGYVRARFLGTTDLGAATSTVYIVGVRQTVSTLSPHHSGTTAIPGGTSITFSTTVHPTRADSVPTAVTFRIYRKVGGAWVLKYQRTALTDQLGRRELHVPLGHQRGGALVRPRLRAPHPLQLDQPLHGARVLPRAVTPAPGRTTRSRASHPGPERWPPPTRRGPVFVSNQARRRRASRPPWRLSTTPGTERPPVGRCAPASLRERRGSDSEPGAEMSMRTGYRRGRDRSMAGSSSGSAA